MRRCSTVLLLLAGCQLQVGATPDESGTEGPGRAATGSSERCSWALVGPDGGALTHAGVEVTLPAGAIAVATEVTLCSADAPVAFVPVSEVVELGPTDLALAVPASVVVPHTSRLEAVALWAIGADGLPTRQLRAVEGGGVLEAPLYRAGLVFAADDARALDPYSEVPGVADVLFVVDNSCSMYDDQSLLVDAIPDVFTALAESGVDYHVGVTSTDIDSNYNGSKGRLREVAGERWIDASTASPDMVFAQMATMGTTGSGSEKGLGATYLALEDLKDTANADFRRDDAQLAVVVVSDEPDYTSNGFITEAEFLSWFDGVAGTPEASAFHSVIDPRIGQAYQDTSVATGGLVLDNEVADTSAPWAAFISGIVEHLYVDEMSLAGTPLDGVVEGWVIPADGSEPWRLDASQFSYDAGLNRVKVTVALADGDEVVLLYKAG